MYMFFFKKSNFFCFHPLARQSIMGKTDANQTIKRLRSNIHRKTPVLESLFNKVTGVQTFNKVQVCNFIKRKFQHRYFPVNIAKFLSTTFFTEHHQWLLLAII